MCSLSYAVLLVVLSTLSGEDLGPRNCCIRIETGTRMSNTSSVALSRS